MSIQPAIISIQHARRLNGKTKFQMEHPLSHARRKPQFPKTGKGEYSPAKQVQKPATGFSMSVDCAEL